MRNERAHETGWKGWHAVRRLGLALAITLPVAACDEPVGVSPAFRGTLWEHALVTNPNGGGPMVVRFGPPDARSLGRD
jgi:hypothetical protein